MSEQSEHCSEEEFMMAYYDEATEATHRHLADCEVCRSEMNSWRRTLDAARKVKVPDPGPDYGAAVWNRIKPRLDSSSWERQTSHRRSWGWLAAGLALAVAGYLAGSWDRTGTAPPSIAESTVAAATPDAILRFALAQHLERSERLLRDVANVQGVRSTDEDSTIPARADRLLANNRLMRMALIQGADPALGRTLEELERWLLDVAHLGPRTASLEEAQLRLRQRGLLLKLDILKTKLDLRNSPGGPTKPATGDDNGISV
ncbi:MAG: hypothetical protein K8J08_11985 [Thermoanaerobaculia bacterium]|nr:hypothetical protein [Thermoanaerobaculia bacterium]